VSVLDPDDSTREAERIAAEYVAWRFRQDEIREEAATLAREVVDDLLSCALARHTGQPDAADNYSDRAFERLYQVEDRDVVVNAFITAVWPFLVPQAIGQLEQLRDFHYIDRDSGLIPVPPHGRHRAEED
jgi:hypothetical protein